MGNLPVYLKSVGMPIGIALDSRFPSRTFQLETDDVLVAYTDGITEAESRDRKFWGQKRLETVLRSSSHQTAEQIMQAILDEVSVFVNGQAQHDDMTLVVLQVQAGLRFRVLHVGLSSFDDGEGSVNLCH